MILASGARGPGFNSRNSPSAKNMFSMDSFPAVHLFSIYFARSWKVKEKSTGPRENTDMYTAAHSHARRLSGVNSTGGRIVALQTHFAKFFERSATSRLCTSSVIPYLSSKSGQAGTMSTVGEGRCAPACVCAIVCPYIPVSACLCVRAHMLSRGPLPTQRLLKTWTRWGLSPGPPAC